MNKKELIFVWIGNILPIYAIHSIHHAVEYSDCRVTLLTTKSAFNSINKLNINFCDLDSFYIRDFKLDEYVYFGDEKFWDGFWIKTIERFYVLLQYSKKYKLKSFFHAELDNIVFNLSDLGYKLDSISTGVFAPKDAAERVVGSLIYFNKIDTLENIIRSVDSITGKKNDMYILGNYFNQNCDAFALPIENAFQEDFLEWNIINPDSISGIFDANAIGQYLLGVDPRLSKFTPTYNKFINEFSRFNLYSCKFSYEFNKLFISNGRKKYQIYNLHIHSKLTKYFKYQSTIDKIIYRGNLNKRTIVSGRYKIIIAYFLPFLRWGKNKLRILLK